MQNNPEAYRDAIAQAVMQQQAPADTQTPNAADPFAYIGAQTFDPNMGAPDFNRNATFDERFPNERDNPVPLSETQDRLDSPNFDPYSQMPVSQNTQDIRDQTGLETPDFNVRFVDPNQIGLPQSQFDDRFGPDPRLGDQSPTPDYLQPPPDLSGGTPYYQSDFFSSNPYLPGGGGRHGGRGNRSQVE